MSLRDSAFAKKINTLFHSTWMLFAAILMLSSPAVFAVSAGDITINEFMANPVTIDDSDGEWIEIKNNSGSSAVVSSWTINDAAGLLYTFANPSSIEANGYYVICADEVLAEVNCDDSWGGGNLNNSTPESIFLKDESGNVVDELSYEPSDIEEGASTEVTKDSSNNIMLTANNITNYSQGNTGTPGANNSLSLPVRNTTTNEEFNSIQAAINDTDTVDGHTIFVKQGNEFKENLTINKELTIKSDNKWGTTIITQGAYRGIDIAADNVTLDGFKIILPDTDQGTAWHLKISDRSNITLKNIVMYGPGKNSGYAGPNNGISGVDINSSQNVVLDNVTVEKYNKNGISVTAKQSVSSTPTSDIKFKNIISRNNGKSNGWAGIALYTTSSQAQVSNIDGVVFEGQSLVAYNPMGLFIEGTYGGTVAGDTVLDLDKTKFENNKFDLVNAQLADIKALDATFDGNNGTNSDKPTRDYIESQIWHDCESSPYLTGDCNGASSNVDLSTDFLSTAGSVEYAIDNKGPKVEDIVLNGMSVNAGDVRSTNCQAIVNSYIVGGEIDLKAKITDVSVDVSSVKYKVRKVNSAGCTVTSTFSSSNVSMKNTIDDSWEDISGFDTGSVPTDGAYTIMLQSVDSLGNGTTSYIDIVVDNTKPSQPQNISIKQNGVIMGCSALVNSRTITVDWDDSVDANFKHYVYQADDTFGSIDYKTTVNTSQRSGNIRDLDGTYQYRVKAVDMAGNESDWSSWCQVTLDRLAPVITFDDLTTKDLSPEITGAVDDDSAEVKVTIDGNDYTAIVSAGIWTIPAGLISPSLSAGNYPINVNATDVAGNTFGPILGNVVVSPITVTSANPPTRTSNIVVVSQPNNQPISQPQTATNTIVTSAPSTINSQNTQVQGVQDDSVDEGNTDVEGVTTVGGTAGQENFASASNSSFNWWWLLALLGLIILGYGIYRFATVEEEN